MEKKKGLENGNIERGATRERNNGLKQNEEWEVLHVERCLGQKPPDENPSRHNREVVQFTHIIKRRARSHCQIMLFLLSGTLLSRFHFLLGPLKVRVKNLLKIHLIKFLRYFVGVVSPRVPHRNRLF